MTHTRSIHFSALAVALMSQHRNIQPMLAKQAALQVVRYKAYARFRSVDVRRFEGHVSQLRSDRALVDFSQRVGLARARSLSATGALP